MKKLVILLIIILVARAVLFVYTGKTKTESSTTLSVQFVSSTITADGSVTSQNKETLNFQTSGRVVYLPFKEGDKILKGQTIAQLDTAKLEANLRQTEQDFTAAKAASEKLYNDQGNKTDESFDEKIKRTAIDATQNKAYDAVVKARQDISDATLRASIQGVLMREDVTVTGANATPATSFVIADPQMLIFKANIPMGSIYYISEGSPVSLSIDGIPNKLQGTVKKIYPSKITLPNGQSVYQADIESDDLKGNAKLDQSGRAIISTNAQNVALVPAWTVLGGKYIWIDNNGTPELKQITTGKIHGNEIEIKSGLSQQDKIVIDPKVLANLKYTIL
jgi:RND family efflux transporter MFP subunit